MREMKKREPRRDRDSFGSGREAFKKFCRFCKDDIKEIDYKDLNRIQRLVNDKGKILPRRISGACAKHQRKLSVAIKRARFLALLPYIKK